MVFFNTISLSKNHYTKRKGQTMKIMQVVTHIGDESAGPSYSVPSLCTALQENGCEVTLYTLLDIPAKKYNFKIKNFPRSNIPTKALGRSPAMFKTLLKDAPDFDLIHSHMLWMAPNYYSGIIADKFKKPYVCSPRGTLSQWALSQSIWKKKIVLALGQQKALNTVSCFHATAEQEYDEIKQAGYPMVPCTVIPNGIDIPTLPDREEKKLQRLTFMSRIHAKKGIDNLIKAWVELQDFFITWELIIVGPDEHKYAKEMKALAKSLGAKRITFMGEVKGQDKIHLLTNSDLFVLPTHSENFGMVVAEALACKVPVICTKGAPWQGLIDNDAGWWIDIGIEPLKISLKEVMHLSETERAQKGVNGREWMKRDFSWDKIAKDMIKTYQWLINNSEKPNFVRNTSG
jgi:glycosyltransferase involved in cell wall biosynthesis